MSTIAGMEIRHDLPAGPHALGVYVLTHPKTGEPVVAKAHGGSIPKEDWARRVRGLRGLSLETLAAVKGAPTDQDSGQLVAWEAIDGPLLSEVAGQLTPAQTHSVIIDVATTMKALHEQAGIYHGGMHLGQFRMRNGRPVLLDAGWFWGDEIKSYVAADDFHSFRRIAGSLPGMAHGVRVAARTPTLDIDELIEALTDARQAAESEVDDDEINSLFSTPTKKAATAPAAAAVAAPDPEPTQEPEDPEPTQEPEDPEPTQEPEPESGAESAEAQVEDSKPAEEPVEGDLADELFSGPEVGETPAEPADQVEQPEPSAASSADEGERAAEPEQAPLEEAAGAAEESEETSEPAQGADQAPETESVDDPQPVREAESSHPVFTVESTPEPAEHPEATGTETEADSEDAAPVQDPPIAEESPAAAETPTDEPTPEPEAPDAPAEDAADEETDTTDTEDEAESKAEAHDDSRSKPKLSFPNFLKKSEDKPTKKGSGSTKAPATAEPMGKARKITAPVAAQLKTRRGQVVAAALAVVLVGGIGVGGLSQLNDESQATETEVSEVTKETKALPDGYDTISDWSVRIPEGGQIFATSAAAVTMSNDELTLYDQVTGDKIRAVDLDDPVTFIVETKIGEESAIAWRTGDTIQAWTPETGKDGDLITADIGEKTTVTNSGENLMTITEDGDPSFLGADGLEKLPADGGMTPMAVDGEQLVSAGFDTPVHVTNAEGESRSVNLSAPSEGQQMHSWISAGNGLAVVLWSSDPLSDDEDQEATLAVHSLEDGSVTSTVEGTYGELRPADSDSEDAENTWITGQGKNVATYGPHVFSLEDGSKLTELPEGMDVVKVRGEFVLASDGEDTYVFKGSDPGYKLSSSVIAQSPEFLVLQEGSKIVRYSGSLV